MEQALKIFLIPSNMEPIFKPVKHIVRKLTNIPKKILIRILMEVEIAENVEQKDAVLTKIAS